MNTFIYVRVGDLVFTVDWLRDPVVDLDLPRRPTAKDYS
jgi:hypothetical protein